MVLTFDRNTSLLQFKTHLVSDVLKRVRRRDRKVTFLVTNLVAQVWELFPPRVPDTFGAVDAMEELFERTRTERRQK
jgi:hypothetical protein